MQEAISFTPQTAASGIAQMLWLIPAVPMLASGVIALLKQPKRRTAATLSIGSLGFSLLVALAAFSHVLTGWSHGAAVRETVNFTWIQFGTTNADLGWVLDPLSAVMLVMVTFVGLLIFIYSTGYMAHDENYTRFFCFLSLFAGAMLGVVIANSLLLLFMCWELVGLTSYLLIGFWYFKPSAAAAAKKAFLTTRVGDVFFLLGIVWLFAQTGTLLFYNGGAGSMEATALGGLLAQHACWGLTAAGAIGLLIFAGAAGKSGQFPLHVWLPDAMEGPTPVSALIHAATMVAAGVYLIARVYPLMSAGAQLHGGLLGSTAALTVVTWVGAFTAVFASLIAVAQNDIKEDSGLLDCGAIGIHDGRPRNGRRRGRDVPSYYPCVLQGAVVHGGWIGDSRVPRGARHSADGRAVVEDAVDVRDLCDWHVGAVRGSYFLLRGLEQGWNS